MILKDDAFVIRQNFGRKLSFSEQLFSILSRIFEDLTWIFSWIWTLTKSRLNAIKNKQTKQHTQNAHTQNFPRFKKYEF